MITIHCSRACAHLASPPELLTAGMSKAVTVQFVFSPEWDGLTKTAVFSNGKTTVDVLAANWDGDTPFLSRTKFSPSRAATPAWASMARTKAASSCRPSG